MPLENPPDGEADQIKHIVDLTRGQIDRRYTQQNKKLLRGVHPKDHGCVKAKFTVLKELSMHLRVGVFATPGKEYDAWIRFSNADPVVKNDSPPGEDGEPAHGSRGMAIKLLNVEGDRLLEGDTTNTQDFLMINQPMFAFAGVADYEVLSEAILKDDNNFKEFVIKQKTSTDAKARAHVDETLRILGGIRADAVNSPVEPEYFSAAPFKFGDDQVMKYSAKPTVNDKVPKADYTRRNYLREALAKRLAAGSPNITFLFQVQLKDCCDTEEQADVQIENAQTEWKDVKFEPVATITISTPQDIDADDRTKECENLVFNPWQGVKDHQPLGGINRLRKAVYPKSSNLRLGKP